MIAPTAPDHWVRERALDTAASFVVQAPAGSGKTTLLVSRYLALLARVDEPEEVLAITFTRKATAEMRRRVLGALATGRGPPPDRVGADTAPDSMHRLAQSVAARDAERGWELSRHPARLRILTFDALCAWLAHQLPWSSGFGGNLRVVDNARAVYRAAARQTLALLDDGDRWHRPIEALLTHLDNDLAHFESLLVHMLGRRDQWLPWAMSDVAQAPDVRRALEAGFERAVEDTIAELHGTLSEALLGHLEELAAALAGRAVPREGIRSPGLEALGTSAAAMPGWRAVADALLTASGRWRARYTGATRAQAAAVGAVAAATGQADTLAARLHALRGLPGPAYSDEQWRQLESLLATLRLTAANLKLEFDHRGCVDFVEVALAARHALGAEQTPTDLALALDHRIAHLLVDEYQDTSHTHHGLLEQLTAGWAPGDGRTAFLVGDPMQSIYRFREADVGLFLWTWRHGLGDVPLEPLRLDANFRAEASIVRWVNLLFPRVLAAEDAPDRGAVRFEPSTAVRPSSADGGVSVHPLLDATSEDEAKCVVGIIEAARAADPAARVGILARARSHLTAVLAALRRAGIDYRGLDLASLGEVSAVQDLAALTRALLHPLDRIAWLAILRAPWCGLTLAQLHALAGDDHAAPMLALASDPKRREALGEDGLARLDRTLAVLAGAAAQRGRLSLRAWTESTWLALGGPACTHSADLRSVDAYLGLLDELEAEGEWLTADSIAERLGERFAIPEEREGAVDVMTIHKSKGLEFDVVIVPGLERVAPSDPRTLLAWTRVAAGRRGSELLIAPIPAEAEPPSGLYEFVRGIERDKDAHETGRLLYVAATRARRQLHLLARLATVDGALTTPRRGSFLHAIWPAVHSAFADAAHGAVAEPPAPAAPTTLGPRAGTIRRLPAGWHPPDPPPAVRAGAAPGAGTRTSSSEVSFDWAGESVRHAGIVVHHMLHRIARDGLDAWPEGRLHCMRERWRVELRARGVPEPELESTVVRVWRALAGTLADPRGRWLLDGGHAQARQELALTGPLDGELVHAVVDRTFVADGVRWIVDYKSGAHEGGEIEPFLDREARRYRGQLERYAVLMSRMERRSIRLGLYFPLLRGWRAWSWGGVTAWLCVAGG